MDKSIIEKRKFQETLKREHEAERERLWKKHAKDHPDLQVTPFNEKPFGLPFNEISYHKNSAVSIGLFSGEVMVYACSGTAIQYWNRKLHLHHTIFVTTKCLAQNFENNRTRDDNLKVRVRLPNKKIISGFLGLFDDNISIVTAFTAAFSYPVNTKPVDPLPHKDTKVYALGRTYNSDLMGSRCSSPLPSNEAGVCCCCVITQAGLGGPVIERGIDGNEHFVGVMVEVPAVETATITLTTYLAVLLLEIRLKNNLLYIILYWYIEIEVAQLI